MKEHLAGGTLRVVMVQEVLRTLKAHEGRIDPAAAELGVTPRTLRLWKHRWPEFQVTGGMEKLLGLKRKSRNPKGPPPRKYKPVPRYPRKTT